MNLIYRAYPQCTDRSRVNNQKNHARLQPLKQIAILQKHVIQLNRVVLIFGLGVVRHIKAIGLNVGGFGEVAVGDEGRPGESPLQIKRVLVQRRRLHITNHYESLDICGHGVVRGDVFQEVEIHIRVVI